MAVLTQIDYLQKIKGLYLKADEELSQFMEYVCLYHEQSARFKEEFILELIYSSFKQKEKLKELLHLGDDLRKEIPFHLKFKHKPFYNCVAQALAYLFRTGTRGAKEKTPLYRLINLLDFPERPAKRNKVGFVEQCLMDNKFPLWRSKNHIKVTKFFSRVKQLCPAEYLTIKEHIFGGAEALDVLAKLYELPSEGNLTLSANPFDLLLMSENAGYKACTCLNPRNKHHNIDADYSNGLMSYCRDDFTLAAFRLGEGEYIPQKRVGRLLLHILPDDHLFIIGQRYGAISLAMAKSLQKDLTKILNESLQTEPVWCSRAYKYPKEKLNKAKSRNATKVRGSVYFDRMDTRVVINKQKLAKSRITNHDIPNMVFKPALCLHCGKNTYHTSYWQCKKCAPYPYKCRECKKRLTQETDYSDDSQSSIQNHHCRPCYKKTVKKCETCAKEYRLDLLTKYQQVSNQLLTYYFCGPCCNKYIIACQNYETCGNLHQQISEDKPDHFLCSNCTEEMVANAPHD